MEKRLFKWHTLGMELNNILKGIITEKYTLQTNGVLGIINKRGNNTKQ